ncbi:hypothetical protein T439DRAFT_236873 [Meredithblackwellia eburnea MCA 4105]
MEPVQEPPAMAQTPSESTQLKPQHEQETIIQPDLPFLDQHLYHHHNNNLNQYQLMTYPSPYAPAPATFLREDLQHPPPPCYQQQFFQPAHASYLQPAPHHQAPPGYYFASTQPQYQTFQPLYPQPPPFFHPENTFHHQQLFHSSPPSSSSSTAFLVSSISQAHLHRPPSPTPSHLDHTPATTSTEPVTSSLLHSFCENKDPTWTYMNDECKPGLPTEEEIIEPGPASPCETSAADEPSTPVSISAPPPTQPITKNQPEPSSQPCSSSHLDPIMQFIFEQATTRSHDFEIPLPPPLAAVVSFDDAYREFFQQDQPSRLQEQEQGQEHSPLGLSELELDIRSDLDLDHHHHHHHHGMDVDGDETGVWTTSTSTSTTVLDKASSSSSLGPLSFSNHSSSEATSQALLRELASPITSPPSSFAIETLPLSDAFQDGGGPSSQRNDQQLCFRVQDTAEPTVFPQLTALPLTALPLSNLQQQRQQQQQDGPNISAPAPRGRGRGRGGGRGGQGKRGRPRGGGGRAAESSREYDTLFKPQQQQFPASLVVLGEWKQLPPRSTRTKRVDYKETLESDDEEDEWRIILHDEESEEDEDNVEEGETQSPEGSEERFFTAKEASEGSGAATSPSEVPLASSSLTGRSQPPIDASLSLFELHTRLNSPQPVAREEVSSGDDENLGDSARRGRGRRSTLSAFQSTSNVRGGTLSASMRGGRGGSTRSHPYVSVPHEQKKKAPGRPSSNKPNPKPKQKAKTKPKLNSKFNKNKNLNKNRTTTQYTDSDDDSSSTSAASPLATPRRLPSSSSTSRNHPLPPTTKQRLTSSKATQDLEIFRDQKTGVFVSKQDSVVLGATGSMFDCVTLGKEAYSVVKRESWAAGRPPKNGWPVELVWPVGDDIWTWVVGQCQTKIEGCLCGFKYLLHDESDEEKGKVFVDHEVQCPHVAVGAWKSLCLIVGGK